MWCNSLHLRSTPPFPYRADIRKQPEFRAQFYAMCVSIGVDPLASNKGIWNKLLGLGGEAGVSGLGLGEPFPGHTANFDIHLFKQA